MPRSVYALTALIRRRRTWMTMASAEPRCSVERSKIGPMLPVMAASCIRMLAMLVLGEAARRLVFGFEAAVVQKTDMGGVDVALEDLQPVALELEGGRRGALEHIRLEVRQRRRLVAATHVGPDDAATFGAGIG